MDSTFYSAIFDWISAHPHWAAVAVFLVAFSESLALVGLFMPGVVLMFAIGALIGSGSLEFWPTAAWAAAGAIAGDGTSYWLGRRYHQQLKVMWPFRTHPRLVGHATDFFYRHGGKSILFGRFVGPMRPVIPAIAGMLEMPVGHFLLTNVASALLWAPTYLLPGVVFGASLGLAAEVATRLAILLVLLAGLIFTVIWLVRFLFSALHPRAHAIIRQVLEWTRLHPVAGDVPAALLDPEHREAKGLTLLALLLLIAAGAFLALLQGTAGLDQGVFDTLQALRTPAMDRLMVTVSELGDWQVLLAVFAVLLGWLLWQRRWQAAAHWAAAAGFSVVLVQSLRATTEFLGMAGATVEGMARAFPSSHATHAMVVYGFLAVLMARELDERWRWLAYVTLGPLIAAIGFSRLYLGANGMSGVLGGLAFGLTWVALLGIAYRRHPAATLSLRGLLAAAVLGLTIAGSWHMSAAFDRDLQRYAAVSQTRELSEQRWWGGGWRTVAAYRSDFQRTRRYPLNLQFSGDLDRLETALSGAGWVRPPELTGSSWLRWLGGGGKVGTLPVLPQVHDGKHERFLMLLTDDAGGEAYAVRLWRSDVIITPALRPLWVGNVSRLTVSSPIPGVRVPRTEETVRMPLDALTDALRSLSWKIGRRAAGSGEGGEPILLVRQPGADRTLREER